MNSTVHMGIFQQICRMHKLPKSLFFGVVSEENSFLILFINLKMENTLLYHCSSKVPLILV
jgi:hypothetical protein